jgi:hypothetical protein
VDVEDYFDKVTLVGMFLFELMLTDAASACGPITARHRRFA